MIKERMASTPLLHACLPGIVRGIVMGHGRAYSIPETETHRPRAGFGDADVVFATDTIGEIARVKEMDRQTNNRRVFTYYNEDIPTHFHKRIPQYSKNQLNYGKDNQKKCNRQVAGRRTLERT